MRLELLLTLLLAVSAAAANGPASVAELSDTSGRRSDTLSVVLPLGSHVAVAVYNTDAVTPQTPAGIAATVRVLWYEQRRVFVGLPGEREASIPYYLPKPGDCTPTGSWVVELKPERVGTFTVPLECNSNTCRVTVRCVELPPSAIGYGFYTDSVRYADQSREVDYLRDMAAHGMNTFTPYAREVGPPPWDYARCLAAHINAARDAGLLDGRFPLLCLSATPEAILGAPRYVRGQCPELVGYNRDEPSAEHGAEVARIADQYEAAGLRNGTAIDGRVALKIGGPVDVWVLHMDSLSAGVLQAARDLGKSRWVYNCALRGTNAAQHRYWTGVYVWAVRPEVALTWTYMHDPASRIKPDGTWNMLLVYDTSSADREGNPIPTVALEGLQEGIIDSRLLQELERRDTRAGRAYLAALRKRVDLGFWTGGVNRDGSSYVWDVPDTQVPPVDCAQVRREVLRLLGY